MASDTQPSTLPLDEFYQQREQKLAALMEIGHDPYTQHFPQEPGKTPHTHIADFVRAYEQEEDDEVLKHKTARHALAGRVMAINSFGKGAFLRIQDGTTDALRADQSPVGRLQIFVSQKILGKEAYERLKKLDLGDIVGVTGGPMRTKTGELSLRAETFQILSKCLRTLPEKWHGLSDVETRYRQRYLDLIMNARSRQVFQIRSRVLSWLRTFLSERGFLEVETPMMHAVAGGAAAKPFVTHHNALDIDLFLRIAPELYLKRLIVGGFDRVFEINRNFRNEGISKVHNPEFTMLEFYQAYANYRDLMDIGETMLSELAQDVLGTTNVRFGEHDISFAKPFAKISMCDAIEQHGGPSKNALRDPKQAKEALRQVGMDAAGLSHGKCVAELFEHYAEKNLIQPTYIFDFPKEVSPLAKTKPDDPWLVERFELYIAGNEIANAFSELNDPKEQMRRFDAQQRERIAGDEEAHAVDDDYVHALEHGMPPTGGFGLGIDRLVMLLTDTHTIRDVILFPQLRPHT